MDLNAEGLTELEATNVIQGLAKGAKNPGLPLKVTIVNERGQIVLDTIVNYFGEKV